jgi:hypothetical protein
MPETKSARSVRLQGVDPSLSKEQVQDLASDLAELTLLAAKNVSDLTPIRPFI